MAEFNNSWNYGYILNQDGLLLIGASSGSPQASFLTSSSGTLSYTFGPGSINIDVNLSSSFFNPIQVAYGGTGLTLLTTYGVLLGEGSNNIHVTDPGTNGQTLIASTTGDPAFATITSSGGTVTFAFGPNSLNIEVGDFNITFPALLSVSSGGTGQTVLTLYGVLLGEGSNPIHVTAAGTNGQVLIASTTGDPQFSTITSTGGTLTFTFGASSLNIDVNLSGNSFFNPLQVGYGGTGLTVMTAYGVLLGEGSNNVNVTAAGTDGQLFLSSSTGDPQFNTLSSPLGTLTFSAGHGSLGIDLNIPVAVTSGGTGQTILTSFGVLIGEGINSVNVTAAGTNGQMLLSATGGDPAFTTVTSASGTLTFTFGPNSLNIDVAYFSNTFFNPLQVSYGGTGRTVFTVSGVLLGEGIDPINATAAGTDGQVLLGSSTGDPQFNTLTSSLGSLTFSVDHNSLNIDLNVPVSVGFGGTGRTLLTTYGVMLGEGSNNVNVTEAGTNGQVLLGSSTGDPQFSTITSTGGTITFTFGVHSLNLEVNLYGSSFFNPLQVTSGGTGRTALTTFGVLLGEGSNPINATAAGTDGQLLIGSSTGDPKFNTLTSSLGTLTFSVSHGGLNIDLVVPVAVGFGGTGRTLLTAYGILIGEGSNGVNVTAAGTNGQVLIASSTGDPKFATMTSTGGTITFTWGVNSLNLEVNLSSYSFFNPLQVSYGGTGRTVLTSFGVLLGEGSNQINATAAGTDGQMLIGSSTGDPKFSTMTSSLGTLIFSASHNGLNIDLNIPVAVGFGGIGRTALTAFGVLLGEGSNRINVTAAGTNGQVFIASSTGDPKFSTITSTGGTLTFVSGVNSLNIDLNIFGHTFFNPLQVSYGGTGRTLLTTFGVLIGEGSNGVNVTAAGTNGQVLIASTTGDPKFFTITSSNQTLTFGWGANSLNIDVVNTSGLAFQGNSGLASPSGGVLNLLGSSPITTTGSGATVTVQLNVVPVGNGGTGLTVLTTFGVLLGEGSNNVNVTAPGTNGQLLLASTTGDPKFATISSTGNTVTFSFGPNSLNLEALPSIPIPLPLSLGGTGRTVMTTFGVLIGEGSNGLNVTAPGTNGQVLIASSTGDPKFATITSTGGTLTFTVGVNSLNMDINLYNNTFLNPLQVGNGGTGRTLLTTFGVLLGEGSNNINVTAPGTNGQILLASTTGDPKFAILTSTGGTVTFMVGPNSLNIEVNIFTNTFFNPLQVANGGTGRTVLTTYGVLLGEGSNNVNVTAAGTSGQVLIASSTGDPKFSTITSTGGTLALSVGFNSLNIDVNIAGSTFFNPLQVGNGGTGRTVLTTFGVLLGEGSNGVNVTAAGTNGQVLIGSTTGDPKFASITSTGGTLALTAGFNSLNIDVNIDGSTFFNPLQVGNGGTGRTLLTTYGVLIGEGSNGVNVTAAGTNGQVLIGSTTGDPSFSTITSTGGTLTFTFGSNSLNIDVNFTGSTFFNPLQVSNGGTGNTVLTTFGVLIGEGSNNVNVTAAGTNGQILIASTTGDPSFSTISSTGGSLLFTSGPNSLNIDVNLAGNTFFNPLLVGNGGTGCTILTTFGVLLGEGSNNINVTAAGTDGQVLMGSSTGDPQFSTITSSLGSLAFTAGHGSLNIDINGALNPEFGGTNRTILTAFGILLGEGSNGVNVTAAGTNGQVLIASTTGDPQFATISSTGGTIIFSSGPNSLNLDVNIAASTFFNPLQVGNGGTGRTLLTAYGVLIGEGSKNINVTAAGTNGQVLVASTTGDPKFATITSTGNTMVFTAGFNSLNIDVNLAASTFFNPVQVGNGGTGQTLLTTYGVLIGEGSNSVHVTAAGTNGQVLIASTTGDPQFATISSTGGTVLLAFGPNSLNIDVNLTGSSFFNPLQVGNGGTGNTILTTFGVLVGEGSNSIRATTAGTNGQVLLAATNANPAFGTITSSGNTVTFSFGPNSLNIESIDIDFAFVNLGGTGRTVLTTFGVLLGEGSNNVNVTAAGTNGQVLLAATGADPKFSTITSTGSTIALTVGPNSLNIDVNLSGSTIFNPVQVFNGGTGQTVLTTFGVLIGEGSNDVNVTAAGTNGQMLLAATGSNPAFATITSTGNTVTFTFGANSLNIDVLPTANVVPVGTGGTGRTILTTYGVLLGEGSNNVNVTAAGTDGQVLIGSSTGDPQFSTITSALGSLLLTGGHNSLNIDLNGAVNVEFGGTNRTVLTTFGVLVGEGSNSVNVTAAGTNGQVLLAATGADPRFGTITSSAGTLSFTFGANSINIQVNLAGVIIPSGSGGTGRTILTTFGVLIGEGSNNVNVTAAGTNGQVLIAATGADPKFSTITSAGGTLTFTFGVNSLNMETSFTTSTFLNPLQVSYGGTGRTILTTFGVLIGEGSNRVNVTAAGTNGQMLIGSTGADPRFATITSSGGTVLFTAGANSLNLETSTAAASYSIIRVTAGTTAITSSFAYYSVDSSGGTVTLNFPSSLTSNYFWTVKDSTGYSFINPIIITTSGGTLTFDGETLFNLINPYGALNIIYNSNSSAYEIF